MRKFILSVVTLVTFLFTPLAFSEAPYPVKYPKDYRQWTHVKSMVIFDQKHPLFGAFGGIHHIYANKLAYQALIKNTDYPKGAAFAFDLLDIKESSGAYVEGDRKFLAVMERDAQKFKDTEGWSWQVYQKGDPTKVALTDRSAQKACSTCHTEVGAKHFVFTTWRK